MRKADLRLIILLLRPIKGIEVFNNKGKGGTVMSYFDYGNDSMLEMYLFESTTLLEQLEDILIDSEKEENLSAESVN